MDNKTIKLELTVAETNFVLQALQQMPMLLIQKIQQQAAPQVQEAPAAPAEN